MPCLARSVGPGATGRAEEQQTGAVHSSASACWGQLTHAGIKTDTSMVQSYREAKLLQEPACPRYMSHLSPIRAAKSFGRGAPYEHALVHKDKRTYSLRHSTKTYSCREEGGEAGRHTNTHSEPITGSVSHGPTGPSRPHVVTTCIDHIWWPEALLARGSPTVLPHWNRLADSRPDSLAWSCPAWLPSCLELCRCHLTSGHWECVVKGDDTSLRAQPSFKKTATAHNSLLWRL